jgi:hypothetical protein
MPAVPQKVTGSSKALKVVKALKAIKSSSLLFVSLTAAACASLVIYSIHTKHQQHRTKAEHKKHRSINTKDTLSNTVIIDSLNLTDSVDDKKDSSFALKAPITGRDTDIVIQNHISAIKNNINNKNTPAVINNANQIIVAGNNKKYPALSSYSNQKVAQGSIITNAPTKNGNQLLLQGVNPGLQLSVVTGQGISQYNGNIVTTLQQPTNGKDAQLQINIVDSNQKDHNKPIVQPSSKSSSSSDKTTMQNLARSGRNIEETNKQIAARFKGSQKIKKTKTVTNNSKLPPSDIDWGILAGVNSSGSFTPKGQNANIYGKLPVDVYLGLFATYHFNDKWAVNSQIRVLNPQNLNSSFTHVVNENKADSGKVLAITDSRKAYFVSIPIHLVYKINNKISLKGGPVINIPVKQISNSTSLQPGIKLDSAYNITVSNQLKAIKYDQKINFGLSGGISLQYKRLIFEATYLKSFSGYNVISDFGNYKSNKGSLQITLGLQLNRLKL